MTVKAVITIDDEAPDRVVRIVMRCADILVPPTPGSVRDRCGRCRHLVFVDVTQEIPPDWRAAVTELVCVACALDDPKLRPGVTARYEAVRGLAVAQQRAERERLARQAARRADQGGHPQGF